MDKNSAETSKREDEPMRLNGPPGTGRERREPADSPELLSDSPEQIEESIKRTGLGLSRTKPSGQLSRGQKEVGAASLTFEEALPGSLGSKEVHYGSSSNYN